MKKLLLILFFLPALSQAQDPQFSQYYSAPLLLNPAMAGATDCYRVGLNARTQWIGLPGGAFNTASFFIDMNYPDYRSGFGLVALHDQIGTPRLSSNELSGFYSFLVPVSKMVNFRLGLQGTYVSRSLDYSRLIFEDQFSGIVVTNPATTDPIHNYTTTRYGDFSTGALMFGEDKYWLGLAIHHLFQPEQGFYYSSHLPIKFSLHGGWNFYKKNRYRYRHQEKAKIIPTFNYKAQDKFDQLDLGIYYIDDPFMIGAWYRGIPIKKDQNIYNRDAIDIQIGIRHNDFAFTYSYDFTISRLNIKNTHGSHEISLVYLFCMDWPRRRKPPRHVRKLPCPDFKRSLKYKGNF